MSSTVCQGLQSYVEPWLVEPRVMGLNLAPPREYFAQSARTWRPCTSASDTEDQEQKYNNKTINQKAYHDQDGNNISPISSNGDLGNWSFIQILSNTSQGPDQEAKDRDSHYVPPLIMRSSSTLNEKSLELCTENLGSETGTDITEYNSVLSSSSDSEGARSPAMERSRARQLFDEKKSNCHAFPPPLTSRSGSNYVYFKPQRESGRLVMKAITVAAPRTNFQAERSDGRLRLHFTKNFSSNFDPEAAEEENEGNIEEVEEENEVEIEEEEEEEEGEEEEEEEEEEDDDCDVNLEEELYGNNGNVGSEMGIGNFQRPSRCKEGGRGNKLLLIREPCWVATS
ncbi:PREDICTED: protein FANTASTIC FOUR 1 [Nelumbo nucifera]|uniref:Protein FANTASTIC FOUR 1 n=1 Tax=Nelumbo nucifera TaxID=4432 RepID=A0A1U7ZPX1_NELNU|nr:PREDICTED: protein FANTASTIC FOUR 1 [Nelumbo nucifera]